MSLFTQYLEQINKDKDETKILPTFEYKTANELKL